MSFTIDRIPGSFRIDPDAAGQDNQRRRGRHSSHKKEGGDSVSISEEARKLCLEDQAEPEEVAVSALEK